MTKQLKLNELKRVVDVDKFSEYAARLKEKKTSEDEIDRILNELGKKTPSRDVLLKTRLGFLLKDVAENERLSKSVREKAKQLRSKWKEFHKKLFLAPKLDVKCDKPTTEGREKAKKTLETALVNSTKNRDVKFDVNSEGHKALLSRLEFEIFENSEKLVNPRYFNRVRLCVHTFESNSSVRDQLLRFEIPCEQFVKTYLSGDVFRRFRSEGSNTASNNPDDIFCDQ